MPGGSGHSQFEPVSPDEDEKPASEGMWLRLMYMYNYSISQC